MAKDKETLPFGRRYGFEAEIPFQVSDMNETLRTEFWNAFYFFIIDPFKNSELNYAKVKYQNFHKIMWVHFFKRPFDDFSTDFTFITYVKNYMSRAKWYLIYEFFEFILTKIKKGEFGYDYDAFLKYISVILSGNYSGYIILKDRFIPIINEAEISEIQNVQDNAKRFSLAGLHQHLNSSIELLAKKPHPDYRNSIKESISMVEAISRIIEPTENSLGKALKKLDKGQKISNTLKAGFEKLYAYTNDKNGIRHALMEEQSIGLEDARFFLIACSAFTNYLIEKARREDLIKG